MGNYASDKKHTKFFGLKLNLVTDSDIIKALDEQQNKQAFLKQAIRFYTAVMKSGDDAKDAMNKKTGE